MSDSSQKRTPVKMPFASTESETSREGGAVGKGLNSRVKSWVADERSWYSYCHN